MADLRGASPSGPPSETHDLIQRYVQVFMDKHSACDVARSAEPADPRVRAVACDVVAMARGELLAGRTVRSELILLTSDGLRTIELPDLPAAALNDGADHRRAIARVHYGVRTLVRRDKLHVHAAIMTQMAWGSSDARVVRGELTPSEAPDRFEMLLVVVQTPSWAGMAVTPFATPGRFTIKDESHWQHVVQPSLLIDGMLASPIIAATTAKRVPRREQPMPSAASIHNDEDDKRRG
jgi:hypothetical protein